MGKSCMFTLEIVIAVAVSVIVVAIITTTTTTTTTTRHLKGVSFLFYCTNMWCMLVFLMPIFTCG
jgi:hypothetical protein